MKQNPTPHRRAAAWLFAAAALPFTPLAAQDAPVVNAPPPTITAPPPVSVAPPPRPVVIAPQPAPAAARPAPTATSAAPSRPAVRTARAAPRAAAPVRRPVAAPVEAAPAPIPAPAPAVSATAEPALATPVDGPALEPVGAASAPTPADRSPATLWPWLLGAAALLIAAIGLFVSRRRRRAEAAFYEEAYEEPAYAEPVAAAPEPAFAPAVALAPAAIVEEVTIADAADADVAALAADSEPAPGRPWLEFLMRPVRAGVEDGDTTVEFELTVGNTGSAPANDVRVSTWMVAAGEGTDMERSLIEPPADATHSEMSIAAGDGARVDGAISLPGLRGSVLPVVVADARYRLPDGSEGRTHASFAIGLPSGDGLEPFAVDLPTGMQDNVEARLHGEPERV
jgi:hypothetical protein